MASKDRWGQSTFSSRVKALFTLASSIRSNFLALHHYPYISLLTFISRCGRTFFTWSTYLPDLAIPDLSLTGLLTTSRTHDPPHDSGQYLHGPRSSSQTVQLRCAQCTRDHLTDTTKKPGFTVPKKAKEADPNRICTSAACSDKVSLQR